MTGPSQGSEQGNAMTLWVCPECGSVSQAPANDEAAKGMQTPTCHRTFCNGRMQRVRYLPASEVEGRIEALSQAITEHREQGLRDSFDHGDALDYIARSQKNDERLYAALHPEEGEGK